MVRTDINKNLIKTMGNYPVVKDDSEIDKIREVVAKEALRKKGKKSKARKGKKKDCGCDKR